MKNSFDKEQNTEKKRIFSGEATLLFAVLINSFGVVLMLDPRRYQAV